MNLLRSARSATTLHGISCKSCEVEGKCEEGVAAASDETFFASITKKNFSEKHLCVCACVSHMSRQRAAVCERMVLQKHAAFAQTQSVFLSVLMTFYIGNRMYIFTCIHTHICSYSHMRQYQHTASACVC